MSLAYRSFIASAPQATPSLFRPLAPSLLRYRSVSRLRILCILHLPTALPANPRIPEVLGHFPAALSLPRFAQLLTPVSRLSLVASLLAPRSFMRPSSFHASHSTPCPLPPWSRVYGLPSLRSRDLDMLPGEDSARRSRCSQVHEPRTSLRCSNPVTRRILSSFTRCCVRVPVSPL